MSTDDLLGENGLACYNCHVHVANDFVGVVNKLNSISASEIRQLKECDEDRSDVTQKYDSMAILLTFVLFLC
jgi:hypothetical protein